MNALAGLFVMLAAFCYSQRADFITLGPPYSQIVAYLCAAGNLSNALWAARSYLRQQQ